MNENNKNSGRKINTVLLILILACAAACAVFSCFTFLNSRAAKNDSLGITYKKEADSEMQEKLTSCYNQIRSKTDFVPEIAVVLGSGLDSFADSIDKEGEISYADIDGFPVSTAPGHEGKFVYGMLNGRKIICMKGRIHLYEGYKPSDVVLPLRVMRMMGAEKIILTNSVGTLNPDYHVGDFMLVTNHISLFIPNPLIGANIDSLGTRFPDLGQTYDAAMQDAVRESAADQGIVLREGVLVQLTGPSYETESEDKMLRQMGADAVGMSTVIEAIAARHAGMQVCVISYISALTYYLSNEATTEEGVLGSGEEYSASFVSLLTDAIAKMD